MERGAYKSDKRDKQGTKRRQGLGEGLHNLFSSGEIAEATATRLIRITRQLGTYYDPRNIAHFGVQLIPLDEVGNSHS